jgi:hypothetical protein
MKDKVDLWSFINDINFDKKNIINDENKKSYSSFMINKIFSMSRETIFYANEVNKYNLSPEINYMFYRTALPKKKRFIKYLKQNNIKDLPNIMKYYNVSQKQAIEYMDILSNKQIKKISDKYKKL